MTIREIPTCSACSLLCPGIENLELSTLDSCSLRREYLQLPESDSAYPTRSPEDLSHEIAQLLCSRKRPLIWLDGADVQTTRCAVQLCQVSGAAIAVSQSTGQRSVQQVMASDGWLGTTLADMTRHSRLILTLGDRCLENSPLLVDRFFSELPDRSQRHWFHISDKQPDNWPHHVRPDSHLVWPRSSWYANVVSLQLGLRRLGSQSRCVPIDLRLIETLGSSSNTTVMFDPDELTDEHDQMLVQQLLHLCRYRSQYARCNLLAWDSDVGSVTAQTVLLWLTGCCGFARPTLSGWSSHDSIAGYSWSDWQEQFDGILMIRCAPSMRRLPQLSSDITLCENPRSVVAGLHHGFHLVAAAGLDCDAFFCRGDHAMISFSKGQKPSQATTAESNASKRRFAPTATELLSSAARLVRSSRSKHLFTKKLA